MKSELIQIKQNSEYYISFMCSLSDDKNWLTLSPILFRSLIHKENIYTIATWISLGGFKDTQTPFRPWPQIGFELRENDMLHTWVAIMGIALCVQIKHQSY